MSRQNKLIALVSAFVIVAEFALIAFTPLKTLIPGYPSASSRREALQAAIKVDSLQEVVSRWELYSTNLLRIVEGQEPIKIDSLIKQASKPEYTDEELRQMQEQDSLLRAMVAAQEQLALESNRHGTIDNVSFIVPIKGAVAVPYTAVTHPYLELAAPANSVVMAILDGAVIATSWSSEEGYIVVLQHSSDIISIYRHNQKLLVKTGDKVAAGATVGLAGSSDDLGEGDCLQFELWHRGETVDPEKYIKF